MWLLPALLIIPNVALDITEHSYSVVDKLINVLLPAGLWLVLAASTRRTWLAGLLFIPVMVLCAFQIVLLFLYGESIIAVDMFLNVVTTNPSEACELLGNLGTAIFVVCAIYLPPIIMSIVLCVKGCDAPLSSRRPALIAGGIIGGAGLVMMIVAMLAPSAYRPDRRLFPVNVVSNMIEAGCRATNSVNYSTTSAGYTYNATCTDTCAAKEIVVMVIGETSRASNWQINGYNRETNPRLSRREGLVTYSHALSESNTTHKSVPLMMSHYDAAQFADSLNRCKSIITAFKEAGYATAWLSNQHRNHSYIDAFGEEADRCSFLYDDGHNHYDGDLAAMLKDEVERAGSRPLFVVLHSYGSHFNYSDRYPAGADYFKAGGSDEVEASNRTALINAYDNSIRYTDAMLDSVISILEATGRPAVMIYAADHGEDIYDDDRGRFLHASPTPTYYQLHVPVVAWLSEPYRAARPELYEALAKNTDSNVSSSRSISHTLLMLGGVSTPMFDPTAALCSPSYTEPSRVFLNDYNEAVGLPESGLRSEDFAQLTAKGISLD